MKNNNIHFTKIKQFSLLFLFSLFIIPMYGNLVKLSLQGVDNCNAQQLDVGIYIKASDLNTSSSTFKLGNSSLFLNFNEAIVHLASYTSVEFSANTSGQATQAHWLNQSWDANNEYGILNILLRKEPGGTNDYLLSKTTWIQIGTATFNWVGPQVDPEIKIHDKYTTFNQEVNDGMGFHQLEDFPSIDINEIVGTVETIATCDNNGAIEVQFPDLPNRTTLDISIDGGTTFPYSTPDNAGSFTINNLVSGTYQIALRSNNCTVDLGPYIVTQLDLPIATASVIGSCDSSQTIGIIRINFEDSPQRTGIRFSLDGGLTYPYLTNDNLEFLIIDNLVLGTTYDLWTIWGAYDCPVDMPDVTITNSDFPTASTLATSTCGTDGSITMSFTDHPSRTALEFSLDGGVTYPYITPDNVGSYTVQNLAAGSYDVWARWESGQCPAFLNTETVQTFDLPQVTSAVTGNVCANDPTATGILTFTFADSPQRSNIEFSTDGGQTYPYNVGDNQGTFTVNVTAGTYDLWARWGNDDCPIDLPDATLTPVDIPTITNVTSIGACSNGGALVVTFPNHPNRTHIRFSTDGGNTFPHLTTDDVGTYLIGNMPAGTPDLWVLWGDNTCPVDLADVTIGSGGTVSNIVMKLFLEGALDPSTQLMADDLRTQNLIPVEEPYAALGYTHVYFPSGMQIQNPSVVLGVTGNDAIVDWVFYKVHHASDPTNVLVARSALLQRDGDIVDVDGVTPMQVDGFQLCNTVITVHHRNHLGIKNVPGGIQFASLSNNLLLLDLSQTATNLAGNDPVKVDNGIRSSWAGDASNDATISAVDRSTVWNDRNNAGYHLTDVNMDGVVNAIDRSLVWNNRNKYGIMKQKQDTPIEINLLERQSILYACIRCRSARNLSLN